MRLVMVAVLALGACSTPYQPMGLRGGFADKRMGPGQFYIRVHVNAYTSRGTAFGYLYRRAQELCKREGFLTFRVVDRTGNSRANQKTEFAAVVACEGRMPNIPAPREVLAEPTPRPVTTPPVSTPKDAVPPSVSTEGNGDLVFMWSATTSHGLRFSHPKSPGDVVAVGFYFVREATDPVPTQRKMRWLVDGIPHAVQVKWTRRVQNRGVLDIATFVLRLDAVEALARATTLSYVLNGSTHRFTPAAQAKFADFVVKTTHR